MFYLLVYTLIFSYGCLCFRVQESQKNRGGYSKTPKTMAESFKNMGESPKNVDISQRLHKTCRPGDIRYCKKYCRYTYHKFGRCLLGSCICEHYTTESTPKTHTDTTKVNPWPCPTAPPCPNPPFCPCRPPCPRFC